MKVCVVEVISSVVVLPTHLAYRCCICTATDIRCSDMLSEKAKGKQRAIDPEPEGEPDSRSLTIRFTEGIPDLVLLLTSADAVRDVKAKVRVLLEAGACR